MARGQYGADEYGGFEFGAAGVVGTIAAPVTTLSFGAPRSDGATFPLTFPATFGEILGPTLTYGVQVPETTLALESPEPGVAAEGVAPLSVPTTTLTLGTITPGVGYRSWQVAGTIVERTPEETATAQTLALTFRVESEALLGTLRALKSDEGKVDILPKDDGGFVAVDRANGGNTYDLTPPVQRVPLREGGTFHVERFEESLVAQEGDAWRVEVEFARDADRTDSLSISESAAADEWGLTTRYGTLATSRVDADVVGTGEGGVQRFELVARLTFAQAHAFEAAFARLGAGRVRSIPDAPNVAVDDTAGDVATVTLDTPAGQDTISDGDYLVMGWESGRVTEAYQEVSFTVAEK